MFAGNAALRDDGQVFSCDLTPHGKARSVYTLREPLHGAISAITPFNHPLNQVAHKVAPSIATNNRMVLKPTEKTPLTALLLADMLYEAGLPPRMLSVVTGDPREIADELLTNPTSISSPSRAACPIGKYIAAQAVYKRQVLELGGNDPHHRHGGRRPRRRPPRWPPPARTRTRPALHRGQAHAGARAVADALRRARWSRAREAWTLRRPADPSLDMGTVIDERRPRVRGDA